MPIIPLFPLPTPDAVPLRRLRVLQVIDSLVVGGAEQLMITLAGAIDAARYDLHVCSLASVDDSPIAQELRALGVPVFSLGGVRLREPWHVVRLAALVRQQQIDVLHTHLDTSNIIGAAAGALARRPVVATLHNVRQVYSRFGTAKQFLQVQAMRWGTRTIIACAPEVRTVAVEQLRLPADKVVDVPNGIDTASFAESDGLVGRRCRRELLGDAVGPLIVCVGNVLPGKGHEHLVAATGRVVEHLPGVRVAIVGRLGTHEAVVRACIKRLRLEDQVLLTGQRRDVAALIAAADVFTLPSLWEGLPLALLEAMAVGKPVVATAVGGIPRVVEDGVTGRLVAAGDDEALAGALLDLLRDPETARRLAAAGRERVLATYGAETWASHLESIYDQAANRLRDNHESC